MFSKQLCAWLNSKDAAALDDGVTDAEACASTHIVDLTDTDQLFTIKTEIEDDVEHTGMPDPIDIRCSYPTYGKLLPSPNIKPLSKAEYQRVKRANETLEERLIRLEKDAERKRLQRLHESEDERARRLARCAERNRERRMCETDAERARRRESDAARARERRGGTVIPEKDPILLPEEGGVDALRRTLSEFQSDTDRVEWLEKYASRRKYRRSTETEAERAERRKRDAMRARVRRERESEQERAARRMADAYRARVRRAFESEEERRTRLARNAERKRNVRSFAVAKNFLERFAEFNFSIDESTATEFVPVCEYKIDGYDDGDKYKIS